MTVKPLEGFVNFCIIQRNALLGLFLVVTVVLGYFAMRIDIRTIFEDMLPHNHSWVETHDEYKEYFGGANLVTLMVTVEDGDIFRPEVLQVVREITHRMRLVPGVNQMQITSLATRKLKTIRATHYEIDTQPLMWPEIPQTRNALNQLREDVLKNPLVLGQYVSHDLRSTLITADFLDHVVEPAVVFRELRGLVDDIRIDGAEVDIVGEPILNGWVRHHLPQTTTIAAVTVIALFLVLLLLMRTWYGTLLPMVAGTISALWALGTAALLGFNFDPLIVVVAFLITARSISHSVQMITRFDDLATHNPHASIIEISRLSLQQLFRPAVLGISSDAGAIFVVYFTPIPLLEKIAIIGVIWVGAMLMSAMVLTPILLSYLKKSGIVSHRFDLEPAIHSLLNGCVQLTVTGATRNAVLGLAALAFIASGWYAIINLEIGDAQPGSPILWPNSEYNLGVAAVNSKFPGTERMFVVFEGDEPDAIKEPEVLKTMQRFQRYMETQPQIGGSVSLVDVISMVRQLLHEANPRYYGIGGDAIENGQYVYLYIAGSGPDDIMQYTDRNYQSGAVTLLFTDRTGETIRTAFARIEDFIAENPMENADYRLAGGLIGVIAAVNDIILKSQIRSIALALLVVVIFATIAYRSSVAGMFFMVPVLLSNTITFAFMAFNGIGFNISTLPVVALGIGLGVDYSLYVVNGIKTEYESNGSIDKSIFRSLHSAGRGVLITGITMITGVMLWTLSDLRFQAEMGQLIALWLSVSVFAALFVMPALAYTTQPRFIFGENGTGTTREKVVPTIV